jgi:hypothetical protein
MNTIVTAFAHKNRFEFSGSKSGVMAFSASKRERAMCDAHPWKLFGPLRGGVRSKELP